MSQTVLNEPDQFYQAEGFHSVGTVVNSVVDENPSLRPLKPVDEILVKIPKLTKSTIW